MSYGPIDFVALEFENIKLQGKILPVMLELVQNKVIRVIDLVVVQKDLDGQHVGLEMRELAPDLIKVLDPLEIEVTGIVQVEDIDMIAGELENGTTAAILLFENLWSKKFNEAVIRADGRLILQERIPEEVVEETLEIFAREESV